MKGLRKYLTPFAPDQSGAASVLYDLGGIIIICDAGGCAGNICGFDEPRWATNRSAVFSAGLRDMDAILGRDDRLIAKLQETARKIDANFAAVIGTPVPSVIGTDYSALNRMGKKGTGLPVFSVACNGMRLYDEGERDAFLAMFHTLCLDRSEKESGRIGVLGAIPLELGSLNQKNELVDALHREGWETVSTYGFGASFSEVQTAGNTERNLVVSPAGIPSAEYLQQRFGIPFEIRFPMSVSLSPAEIKGKRIFIVHQQVYACSLRKHLQQYGAVQVNVGCWFMTDSRLTMPGDCPLKEEDDFVEQVRNGNYDLIFADETMLPMIPDYSGRFISLPHFAVSGKQVVV